MRSNFLLILVLVVLSGCSATGQNFTQVHKFSEETSTLYILRESRFQSAAYCPSMYLNGEKIGCLKNGGFIRYEIPPGSHALEVRKSALLVGDEPKIEFSSQPNEAIFIEWTTQITDMMIVPIVAVSASEWLVKLDENTAIEKLQELNES